MLDHECDGELYGTINDSYHMYQPAVIIRVRQRANTNVDGERFKWGCVKPINNRRHDHEQRHGANSVFYHWWDVHAHVANGIAGSNVDNDGKCNRCDEFRMFDYQRDGKLYGTSPSM